MIANEQQAKLAAKLYECRDSAKALFGNEYKERVEPYAHKIRQHQINQKIDTLPAVLAICSLPHVKINEMATMLFMAAAVEIIEPSKE